ncbi:MAG TPA: hypothetical protein PKJ33_00760 [Alphaproteobacteria bacterium]|nr:hypothetical protein [Alphaproteobacteria bacterium]
MNKKFFFLSFIFGAMFFSLNALALVCEEGETTIVYESCNSGYYLKLNYCEKCPTNSTTAGTGSTLISDCKCKAGYYGDPVNSIACVSCASGTGNPNATSIQGTTNKNGCYLPASYTGTDITGDYGYSSVCSYTGS